MFIPNIFTFIFVFILSALFLPISQAQGQDLAWARKMGSSQSDVGFDVAADAAGNSYITGYYRGTVDFDPGAGVSKLTSAGDRDIFVAKYDSAGMLLWARSFGGPDSDAGTSIAVDPSGNVLTTGWFRATVDFDPGPGESNLTTANEYSCFISKLDSNGDFVWVKQLGGTDLSEGDSVAADSAGNVYSTGYFYGTIDLDPGAGVSNAAAAGFDDVFLSKLDSAGNFIWGRRYGGSGYDYGNSLVLDAAANIYTIGAFQNAVDFDPGPGISNLSSKGDIDVYVARFDSAGTLAWARSFGASGGDFGGGIAVDSSGSVLTTGTFFGAVDFDPGPGAFSINSGNSDDIFVSKLDAAGNFVWARRLGGSQYDYGAGLVVDSANNVYIAGLFDGTADFDPGTGVSNLTSAGGDDIFVSKLDSSGDFVWAQRKGGKADESAESIAIDGSGDILTTGWFNGTADFNPTGAPSKLTSSGSDDIFLFKLSTGQGGLPPVISSGGVVVANLLPTVSTISPLSIISVFGQNFSTETILYPDLDAQGKLATILGNTCLMMNGEELPIFAVTPGQINAQVSATQTLGPASFNRGLQLRHGKRSQQRAVPLRVACSSNAHQRRRDGDR